MRTATGLALLAIGAILTFAVVGHPSFLNVQVAGVVIMATGIAGLFLPKPSQGWLRRRTVLRRGGRSGPVVGRVDETRYPPYVMLNPGATPAAGDNVHQPGDLTAETAEPMPEDAPIPDLPGDVTTGRAEPATPAAEVVDEYVEE